MSSSVPPPGDGPMNKATYDDVKVPIGGGTSLEDLFPEPAPPMVSSSPSSAPVHRPTPPRPPVAARREPEAYVPVPLSEPPLPVSPVAKPLVDGLFAMDEHQKAALLVFFLYMLVSSGSVQTRLADLVPELFSVKDGYLAVVCRGLLLGVSFYLIRKYMVA